MVFFILLSLFLFYNSHIILSATALACAVLAKLIPIVLLPLFLFELFRKYGVSWRTATSEWKAGLKKSSLYLFTFSVTIAAFYIPFIESAGNMFLTALNYSSKWYFNNPFFHAIHYLTSDNPMAHLVSFSLFVVFFLFILFRTMPFEKKVFYAALGFILLNPTLHPWYLVLAVGLTCIHFSRVVVLWSGLVIVSYTVVYHFKLTGEWHDSPYQLALQYLPLLVLLIAAGVGRTKSVPSGSSH
ncbi:MAG: hypothetical protein GY765_01420, partial [bacterium]|nr:hypothetical protein [bacterium]